MLRPRHIPLLVVLLLAGAAIAIAVAIGSACSFKQWASDWQNGRSVSSSTRSYLGDLQQQPQAVSPADFAWAREIELVARTHPMLVDHTSPRHLSATESISRSVCITHIITRYDTEMLTHTVCPIIVTQSFDAGFPFRCMRSTWILNGARWQADLRNVVPARWLPARAVSNLSRRSTEAWNGELPIPLALLWPGFFANTAIYAGVLAIIPLTMKWLRSLRNRCSQCGYSLAGLADQAACPECGTLSANDSL